MEFFLPPLDDYYGFDRSVIAAEVHVVKHREHPHLPDEFFKWWSPPPAPSLQWLSWFDPAALLRSRANHQRAMFALAQP